MSENLDPHETITLSSDDRLAAALSSTAPVLSISSSAPPVPPAPTTLRYRQHGLPAAIWT